MRPLKVGMLTTFYPPYNFGGDGIGVSRLASALAKRGCDVTVIHDEDAYLMLAGAEPAPVDADPRVKRVGLARRGAISPFLTQQLGMPALKRAQLGRLLAAGTFDVLWYHNVSLIGGPGLLAYGNAVKIYEAHEHWLVCPTHVLWRFNREPCDGRKCLRCSLAYRRPPQMWRYTGLLERNLRHVDAFIAKSEFSRAMHARFGFSRPMAVVPYFLPELEPAQGEGAPPPNRYFLFVGRLERIKGLQDVIPLFGGESGPDLLIVGAGDYEAELRQLAEDKPRVKFVGRLPSDRVTAYYRHAEALIVPSVCYETFGIILIEALRMGTPVIARRFGPFPEIVARGGGVLFEDAAELGSLLDAFTADPALRGTLAAAARRAFADNWREDVVIEQYLDVVRRIAQDRQDGALLSTLRGIA